MTAIEVSMPPAPTNRALGGLLVGVSDGMNDAAVTTFAKGAAWRDAWTISYSVQVQIICLVFLHAGGFTH